ncbi:hypothetical protein MRX96_023722 [Rhipicephalus microplus]
MKGRSRCRPRAAAAELRRTVHARLPVPAPALEAGRGQRALHLASRASLRAGPGADFPDGAMAVPGRSVHSKPTIRSA